MHSSTCVWFVTNVHVRAGASLAIYVTDFVYCISRIESRQMLASLKEAETVAVYEVVLRFQDREEVRLTDRPLDVGSELRIAGSRWLVEGQEARDGRADSSYICVELRERARDPRARSSPNS
jgi:hypothetical protein